MPKVRSFRYLVCKAGHVVNVYYVDYAINYLKIIFLVFRYFCCCNIYITEGLRCFIEDNKESGITFHSFSTNVRPEI